MHAMRSIPKLERPIIGFHVHMKEDIVLGEWVTGVQMDIAVDVIDLNGDTESECDVLSDVVNGERWRCSCRTTCERIA